MIRYLLLAIVGAVSISFMYALPLSGDETFYARCARTIAELVIGKVAVDADSLAYLIVSVRGYGWFLPGMTILMTPVQLLFGAEAPTWALRLGILVVNLALMDSICRTLERRFTPAAGLGFLLVCASSPFLILFASALWGDLIAVLITLRLLLWIDELEPGDLKITHALKAGAVLAAIVYVRGMYLPVVFILAAHLLLLALRHGWAHRSTILRHGFIVVLTAATLISPWSLLVSAYFGPAVTTTSMPISQMIGFGDEAVLQELQREGGHENKYHSIQRTVIGRARVNQVTIKEQFQRERRRALEPVSTRQLAGKISTNLWRYYGDPAGFLSRFAKERCASRSGCAPTVFVSTADRLARATWPICAIILLAYMLVPFRAHDRGYWLPLFGKGLVFLMLLHCFIAKVNGRYHVQLFPIAGMVAGLLLEPGMLKRSLTRWPLRGMHDGLVFGGQILGMIAVILTVVFLFSPLRA